LKRLDPTSETDKQSETLQDHVKDAPGDYAGYDGLGSAFFQKARETGDIAYYDLAEQTLKQALDLAPQDFRAADPLVHMALVYMGDHRFSDALAYAQKAIGTGSGNLAAFAIEGDAYTDVGEYDEAATAYNTVRALGRAISSPLTLAYMSDSRMAYLRYLHGDSAEAIRPMKSAIAAALQTHVPRENLAWLYFELGERYFQAGDLGNADLSYQSRKLWGIGMKGAIALGIASGLLNLLPFLGLIASLALPLAAALLQFNTPGPYIVITLTILFSACRVREPSYSEIYCQSREYRAGGGNCRNSLLGLVVGCHGLAARCAAHGIHQAGRGFASLLMSLVQHAGADAASDSALGTLRRNGFGTGNSLLAAPSGKSSCNPKRREPRGQR
jgi:hypothetical protein